MCHGFNYNLTLLGPAPRESDATAFREEAERGLQKETRHASVQKPSFFI